jgi:hypothetical protein
MNSDDARRLTLIALEAARIAEDARQILRKRDLACDADRLRVSLSSLKLARHQMLFAFVPDQVTLPSMEGGG